MTNGCAERQFGLKAPAVSANINGVITVIIPGGQREPERRAEEGLRLPLTELFFAKRGRAKQVMGENNLRIADIFMLQRAG